MVQRHLLSDGCVVHEVGVFLCAFNELLLAEAGRFLENAQVRGSNSFMALSISGSKSIHGSCFCALRLDIFTAALCCPFEKIGVDAHLVFGSELNATGRIVFKSLQLNYEATVILK